MRRARASCRPVRVVMRLQFHQRVAAHSGIQYSGNKRLQTDGVESDTIRERCAFGSFQLPADSSALWAIAEHRGCAQARTCGLLLRPRHSISHAREKRNVLWLCPGAYYRPDSAREVRQRELQKRCLSERLPLSGERSGRL